MTDTIYTIFPITCDFVRFPLEKNEPTMLMVVATMNEWKIKTEQERVFHGKFIGNERNSNEVEWERVG